MNRILLAVATSFFAHSFANASPSDCGIEFGGPGTYCNDSFHMYVENGKSHVRISGAMKGVVTEIVGYFEKSGVSPKKDGWTTFVGPRDLEIVAKIPSLEMKLNLDELVSMSAAGMSTSEFGEVSAMRFAGPAAEFILEKMLNAGVPKKVYSGNKNSYEAKGRYITCSYTDGIWGFSCEVLSPTDWRKY